VPDAASLKISASQQAEYSLLELGLGLQVLVTRATELQEMCPEVPKHNTWSQTYRIVGHGNNFGQDCQRPAGVRRAPDVSVWASIELPNE